MIGLENPYFKRVQLLIRVLPYLSSFDIFALKGGTAINLFLRDIPRLSVDIDLVYIPIKQRDTSLYEITMSLKNIASKIKHSIKGLSVAEQIDRYGQTTKLIVRRESETVKIEVSPVLRGLLFSPTKMIVSSVVEKLFGYAEAPVVSFDELYAGKICAALDRQHPRDFFDIMLLLKNEGFTDSIKDCFIVYLLSGNRPISELLKPQKQELRDIFKTQFENMSTVPISLKDLEKTRNRLFISVRKKLTDDDRKFILSFKEGTPKWKILKFENAEIMPAAQWKLHNLNKMSKDTRRKAIKKLEKVLYD
ncbi:nucleotidyl transferase AbiEii/AbiGii toxin family protein [bacterium]|nr:nucleotidyl transferase AbiEii/AbiGii toxin family protein [bacterium]